MEIYFIRWFVFYDDWLKFLLAKILQNKWKPATTTKIILRIKKYSHNLLFGVPKEKTSAKK